METSYRGLDYEAGKAMQRLRRAIGLTQVGLAGHLGVSVRTLQEWEAGGSYPKIERLKALIALAIQYQAFGKGSEAEEIRVLWRTTRQKRVLDEDWLSALLAPSPQEQSQDAQKPHVALPQGATPVPVKQSQDAPFSLQEQSLDAQKPHVALPHRVTLVPGEKSLDVQFSPSGLEEPVETAVEQGRIGASPIRHKGSPLQPRSGHATGTDRRKTIPKPDPHASPAWSHLSRADGSIITGGCLVRIGSGIQTRRCAECH